MLSNVQYERSIKQYQVTNPITGDIEYFPNGNAGKRIAMRRAVFFQDPRLHRFVVDLVERYPQVESRAWRAAELLLQGGVKNSEGEALAIVASSTAYGDYLITARTGQIVCDCLDYMDGNAPYIGQSGQRLCKHILALQFTRRLAYRHCGSCGRQVDAELMICVFCDGPVHPY
ncbi:MAG TPA: hypothetical protein VFI27_20225 [candidate division Zixibacteria bacterium]|nr:hypothetical protein [candidate division Zixibacteria bacterium]